MEDLHLGCELAKVIKHYFPGLLAMLKELPDPRKQSYITYSSRVLLMTKILSSIFYISSMRKTSEEFNSETVIENIGQLCGEPELEEVPYWETINRYLARLEPAGLQDIICQLVQRLLRMRTFEGCRIREKYWQVIVDGTQLESSRKKLDDKCLYRVHHEGTEKEYTEYYYYVLEAKLVLHPKIVVSIQTEFVENEGHEVTKQDCELKACKRLMKRLKEAFPCLPICFCADSLYACDPIFRECRKNHWKYLIRFKDGSIPSVAQEYKSLKEIEKNGMEMKLADETVLYDFVGGIPYNEHFVNMAECKIRNAGRLVQEFQFITNLSVNCKNVGALIGAGRMRWKIENQGFNTQKRHGYYLEHLYSHNYQAIKNHYFLIQIGHMIAQMMDAWKTLWDKIVQSQEQKHRRLLESWKTERLKEWMGEIKTDFQIRFV